MACLEPSNKAIIRTYSDFRAHKFEQKQVVFHDPSVICILWLIQSPPKPVKYLNQFKMAQLTDMTIDHTETSISNSVEGGRNLYHAIYDYERWEVLIGFPL
jgi:hypothetical protein